MTAFLAWLQHDTAGLLTLAAIGVAVLLLMIIKFKLEPFIALIVVGLLVGLAAGLPVAQLVGTPLKASDSILEKGFGGILGHIAPIIGLGTVLGAIMERSGGADALTSRLLRLFGPRGAPEQPRVFRTGFLLVSCRFLAVQPSVVNFLRCAVSES
jgi:GntP family gluconate:H+ symporter